MILSKCNTLCGKKFKSQGFIRGFIIGRMKRRRRRSAGQKISKILFFGDACDRKKFSGWSGKKKKNGETGEKKKI